MLYNLFEWPGRKNSRLAVIGVANTMDLPERLLQRIASRLAGRRLNFHPYNRAQLHAILIQRLGDLAPLFEPNALDYACRKVLPKAVVQAMTSALISPAPGSHTFLMRNPALPLNLPCLNLHLCNRAIEISALGP